MRLSYLLVTAVSLASSIDALTIDPLSRVEHGLLKRGKSRGGSGTSGGGRQHGDTGFMSGGDRDGSGRANSPSYVYGRSHEPSWPHGYAAPVYTEQRRSRSPDRDNNPRDNRDGVTVDHNAERIYEDYGPRRPDHADSVAYHETVHPHSAQRAYRNRDDRHPRSGGRKEALRHTSTRHGTANDEKKLNSEDFLSDHDSRKSSSRGSSLGSDYDAAHERATVLRASGRESTGESASSRRAKALSDSTGYPRSSRDTRSSPRPERERARPLIGPAGVPGYAPPVYSTGRFDPRDPRYQDSLRRAPYDPRYPPSKERRSLILDARDGFDDIGNEEGNTGSNDPQTLQAEYQDLIDQYSASLDNVSAIVIPIVKDMVSGSNSSLVFETALAVMTLVDPTLIVDGPFKDGMHAFDAIEDEMYEMLINPNGTTTDGTFTNGTAIADLSAASPNGGIYNITNLPPSVTHNATLYDAWMEILAVHEVMIELYYTAWDNATQQLNATGLADNVFMLQGYLDTNNTSIMPAGWAETDPSEADDGGDSKDLMVFLGQVWSANGTVAPPYSG